jgi:transposase
VTTRDQRLPDDRFDPSEGPPNGGQPAPKVTVPRCIGRTNDGLNSKLHAVCDERGKPVHLLLTAGYASDYTGARCLLPSLSNAKHLLADRGYDADWFITALKKQGVTPCIRRARTERHNAATTRPSTNNATKSRSCSGGSRIGVGLPGGMIAVPIPFSDDLSRCNRHLLSQRMSPEPRALCSKRIAGPWNLDGFGELLHDRVRTRSCRHSGVIGEICNSYLRRCDPICLDPHSV